MGYFTNNMIIDLIIQSRINNDLLNEVNNAMFNDNNGPYATLKAHQETRVEEYYHHFNMPIYNYFDGTNLINSLLSSIVIPIEYLKGKYDSRGINGVLQRADSYEYSRCKGLIQQAIRHDIYYTNSYTYEKYNISVYTFIRHLRNSICHSGNGHLHFFPGNAEGVDITHIYFYDEDSYMQSTTEKQHDPHRFLVKLDILHELVPIVESFNKLVLASINTENNPPYDKDKIREEIIKTGNNIPEL